MRPNSRLTVIMNEASGGAASHPDLEVVIGRTGLDVQFIRVKGAEVQRAAERAAASSHTLIAAGGDGTVSTVASVALRTRAIFGVVPLGTLNHFARDAGIPTSIDAAVAAIARGYTRALDVGDVNGQTFLNNASLGIYPHLVWERETERRRGRGKWTAFSLALVRTWRRYPTVMVRMTVGDVHLAQRTPFVFVGNGEYQVEGLKVGTRPSLSGGRLSVFVAPDIGRFEALMLPVRALAGRLIARRHVEWFSTGSVEIETRHRYVTVALDGELVVLSNPIRCRVKPRALRLIVPPTG